MGHPICLIEFHGQDESWEVTSGVAPVKPYGNAPAGDLLECRTEKRKSIEAPAGTFDIKLVRRKDDSGRTWQDRLRPQDLVVIQMMNYQGRSGEHGAGELHTVMIGLIDTITDTTGVTSRGTVQRVIHVRGRDIGKLFINGMVTYWTFFGATLLAESKVGGAAAFLDTSALNAKPDEVVQRLLERIYQRFLQIRLTVQGGQRDFWDLLAYRLDSYGVEIPAGLDWNFLNGEGSFWSFFAKAASAPFHEMWIDTRRVTDSLLFDASTSKGPNLTLGKDNSSTVMIMRPTPFPYLVAQPRLIPRSGPVFAGPDDLIDIPEVSVTEQVNRRQWDAIVRHELGTDDLIGEPFDQTLSVSDDEHFNFYLTFAQYPWIPEKPFLLSVPGILDEANFRRYGYRPMLPTTSLLQARDIDTLDDPMVGFYARLNWRLASWNVFNDRFLSGTKVIKLAPHIHVGDRVLDRSSFNEHPYEFYVESIVHHFVQNEHATTSLGLTRGLTEQQYQNYDALLLNSGLRVLDHSTVSSEWRRLLGLVG